MPFMPARKACRLANTNHCTTFGTDPFNFFIPNELSDPDFIYHFEIVNHAHSVLGPVSPIQLLQPGARETVTATRAILDFTFDDLFAVSDFTRSAVF